MDGCALETICTERFSADFGVEEWFDFNVFLRDGNDRDLLATGLVDHMHIVVIPPLLGRGVRLWDELEGLENDYETEATSSPSGVTHLTFTRTGARDVADGERSQCQRCCGTTR